MSHGNPDTDTLLLANLTSDPEIARRLRILAAIERRYEGASFNDPDVRHATVLKITLPQGTKLHGDLLLDMDQFAEDGEKMTAEERAGRAAGELAQVIIDLETDPDLAKYHRTPPAIAERKRQAHAILGALPPLANEAQIVARAFLGLCFEVPFIGPEREMYMAAAFTCVSWKQIADAVESL